MGLSSIRQQIGQGSGKKRQNRNIDVKIITPTEVIKHTSCETLLGNVIHEGFKPAQYSTKWR